VHKTYNKPIKSDSQRYHIGCKRKGATNAPALLTAYGGVINLGGSSGTSYFVLMHSRILPIEFNCDRESLHA